MPLHRSTAPPPASRVSPAPPPSPPPAWRPPPPSRSGDDQPVPPVRTIAETAITRYFDIEANKAASIRALGLCLAEQRDNRSSRYLDLEANEAPHPACALNHKLANHNRLALTRQSPRRVEISRLSTWRLGIGMLASS